MIGLSVGCWFFLDKKMNTLAKQGSFMSSTYYVRVRNRKILASTCLTNESVLQEAKLLNCFALLKLFNTGDIYQKKDYFYSKSKRSYWANLWLCLLVSFLELISPSLDYHDLARACKIKPRLLRLKRYNSAQVHGVCDL